MKTDRRPSPNQSARTHGTGAVRLVIAHTPEGSYDGTVRYCLNAAGRRVSYHLLLNEDGTEATQLVPWTRKAWHAGAYNSLSDGVAAAGFARDFDVGSPQSRAFARVIAQRLHARGLPARWSKDGGGSGFCRHADLQTDRSDPMSVDKWRRFVRLVQAEHRQLTQPDHGRVKVLRAWILARRKAGWSWARIKSSRNWAEFVRRGGR